jgi:hypothetical protein
MGVAHLVSASTWVSSPSFSSCFWHYLELNLLMLLFLFQVDLTRHMRLQDAQLSGTWARPLPFTPALYEELEQQVLI